MSQMKIFVLQISPTDYVLIQQQNQHERRTTFALSEQPGGRLGPAVLS